MRRTITSSALAFTASMFLACSSADGGGADDDAGAGDDASKSGTDTASGADSGRADTAKSDASTGGDSATGTDTATAADTATGSDTATGADTATATDTAVKTDTATATDTAVKTDTATATDTAKADTATATDTATGSDTSTTGGAPMIAGCRIFPPDNPWNLDISSYPKNPNDATYRTTMHTTTALHPDWGTWTEGYGIPWNTGTGAAAIKMTWTASWGATESDKLPCSGSEFCYPIPTSCKIEGGASASTGSDRHLLFLDTAGAPNNCTLYELYNAQNWSGPNWVAQNGAIFHLGTNALRPDGWTSADAAGLPVLPGLVRYDEVAAGEIKHAIRFTMNNTYQGYIHPATHAAGLSSSTYPPQGLRMRLTKDIAGYTGPAKVILTAMKKYGIILADNGSNWFITGDSDDRWGPLMDGIITAFGTVHGGDFESVDTGAVSTAGL
jgi:hypothetical protein